MVAGVCFRRPAATYDSFPGVTGPGVGVENGSSKYYPVAMKPIAEYIEICRGCSEQEFARRFEHAFLVHSSLTQRAMQPVRATRRRMTIDRLVIETERPPSSLDNLSLDQLYQVVELRSATTASPIRIGCGEDCEVQINDRSVSRLHASIHVEQGRCLISDENSSAGTQVNGREVRAGESVEIYSGDRIVLGYLSVIFFKPADFYLFVRRLFVD